MTLPLMARHPSREHIVPTDAEFCHFHTNYDPAWEETFLPGKGFADCATAQAYLAAGVASDDDAGVSTDANGFATAPAKL